MEDSWDKDRGKEGSRHFIDQVKISLIETRNTKSKLMCSTQNQNTYEERNQTSRNESKKDVTKV